MDRIIGTTATPNLFGAGKSGFTAGNAATGVPATVVTDTWLNGLQEEVIGVIEGAGLAPSAADNTLLRQAIAKMIAASATAIVIQQATFAPGIANGNPVRWDSGNNRFALAHADGTNNDLAVGFADVINAAVYCFGRSRAGLFAGLTPGSRYYLSAGGALSTSAAADVVYAGIALAADTLFVDIDPQTTGGTQPQFDNSTRTATDEFVRRQGHQFADTVILNANTVLDASYAGKFVVIGGPYTVTLPSAASLPAGAEFSFWSGSAGATVARSGVDVIAMNGGVSATNVALGSGDTLSVVSLGVSQYQATGGSAQIGSAAAFINSLALNGYQRLPSGLILQWGTISTVASAVAWTFPIAFPVSPIILTAITNRAGALGGKVTLDSSAGFSATSAVFRKEYTDDSLLVFAIGR